MEKLTVRDFDPQGRRVLMRVDFNVPIEDGRVKDDSRIRASLPTIRYLLEHGASVVLMSHLGRPKGKVVESFRLRPVAQWLSALMRMNVPITGDPLGIGTRDAVLRLKPGQVMMLENLRFHAEEEANADEYAKTLASYGDVYVNDAFGTAHRAHASTVGITKYLPAYAGLLMESEIEALSNLLEKVAHPFAAVIGGAKVSGKLGVLNHLMDKVDTFVIGGGMANTFLVAKGYAVGKSLLERDLVEEARTILANAEKKGVQFILPTDVVVAKEVTRGAEHKIVPVTKIPNSWSAVDIGPASTELFKAALDPAKTVFWNGPLGVFEVPTFGDGTRAIARHLAAKAEKGATVVIGGGDSVAAVEELGLTSVMTHISTGGGASLEFMEGRDLPGLFALLDKPAPQAPMVAKVAVEKPARVKAQVAKKPTPAKKPTLAKKPIPNKQRTPGNKPTPTKRPVAKKPVAKKPVAKKAVPAKKPVPKAAAKNPAAKKPVAKKAAPAKKPIVKKAAPAKKPVARKPVAKKPVAKKAPASKSVPVKKPAKKSVPVKKPASRSKK
ncbi:MAG: phosphoglycerate kinase [Chloroflexota bacterium]|jgi:phosphoglycerate kinase|nr:phosphoglycerate kinase [Chloroflexota bacterium]